jgi:predicted MFS family arabinose efflux permease
MNWRFVKTTAVSIGWGYLHHPALLQCAPVLDLPGIWPLLSVASNDLAAGLAPFGEGAAMGLFNAVAAIASALVAIAAGKVADMFGYSAVSLFAALGALLALACVTVLVRTRRVQPQT